MNFIVRQATPLDADAIAQVHMASIQSVGAKFYSPDIVAIWGAPRDGTRYVAAMMREVFFVAISSDAHDEKRVLGFSSYRVEREAHRIAVYVDGPSTRCGVGRALFLAAEVVARERGATEIQISASLAAVDFYKSLGCDEVAAGHHQIGGKLPMACVFMRKSLVAI